VSDAAVKIPHCEPGEWPASIPQDRFAAHIHRALVTECRVALLGLPDDLGVRLNNGRPGAREGPASFRAALAKYGVAAPDGWDWPRVFDAGDVRPARGDGEEALHETHRRVSEAARALVELGLFPIAVGGGHDLTFAFVRGVWEGLRAFGRGSSLAGFYFDAHLDVRETVGSGMPFRGLIEECGAGPLNVVGLNPFANAREHCQYFRARGGAIVGRDALHAMVQRGGPATGRDLGIPDNTPFFCSVDLDVIDASAAPGVSALNPDGLAVGAVGAALRGICRQPNLCCLDFMELSPPHDEQARTARAAAHLFLEALRGFQTRGTSAAGGVAGRAAPGASDVHHP